MTTAKKRILIVDDELSFTRLLKLNLERTGRYEVEVENVSSRAVSAALHFRPDLVLLDVMMPGLDGGSVAAKLQEHPVTRPIIVVFVTAAVSKEEVVSHQGQIGNLRFIAKPVEFSELLGFLDRLWESSTHATPVNTLAEPAIGCAGPPPAQPGLNHARLSAAG